MTVVEIARALDLAPAEVRRRIARLIREALVEQAVAPVPRRAWTHSTACAAIRAYRASSGRLPRQADFEGSSALPSRRTLARLFGSTSAAMHAAGVVEVEQTVLFEIEAAA